MSNVFSLFFCGESFFYPRQGLAQSSPVEKPCYAILLNPRFSGAVEKGEIALSLRFF
jgi:hypothetical protein